jgi:hypothetical protein
MDTQKFEIEGLKEVVEALKDLPAEMQNKIIKAFLAKAGKKFVVNDLRTAMPYGQTVTGHGKLAGRERYSVKTDPNDKNAIFAGVSNDSFWLRWTDLGTQERKTKKGYNRGMITGKQQVRSVIDSDINPIIDYARDEFGNEIKKNLERRIKRVNKKLQ